MVSFTNIYFVSSKKYPISFTEVVFFTPTPPPPPLLEIPIILHAFLFQNPPSLLWGKVPYIFSNCTCSSVGHWILMFECCICIWHVPAISFVVFTILMTIRNYLRFWEYNSCIVIDQSTVSASALLERNILSVRFLSDQINIRKQMLSNLFCCDLS